MISRIGKTKRWIMRQEVLSSPTNCFILQALNHFIQSQRSIYMQKDPENLQWQTTTRRHFHTWTTQNNGHTSPYNYENYKAKMLYLPQSPKVGPAPAARAFLPSSVNPYAMVPVPAIRTHPWSFPIVPQAKAATASFWTYNLTSLGNISLFYIPNTNTNLSEQNQTLIVSKTQTLLLAL